MSRQDAAKGVELTIDDDSRVRIVRQDGNMVVEDWTYPDGFLLRVSAIHGVHAVEIGEVDISGGLLPDTIELTTFDSPFPPEPQAVGEWKTQGREQVAGEGEVPITYTSSVTRLGELLIGSCRYRAVSVSNRIAGADETRIEEVDFLPELGIAVLRRVTAGDGSVSDTTPLSIIRATP